MAVKNKSQKKHAKALARKGKKRKVTHHHDPFAFLNNHPSVQRRTALAEVKKTAYIPPTVIAEQTFPVAVTFPQKHSDVMALLDRIQQRNVENYQTGLYPCYSLDDNEAEQVAQLVRANWSLTDEDLAILERPRDPSIPDLMSFEDLISFSLEEFEPDELMSWDETSSFGFVHMVELFKRFVHQDWLCKLTEYALVKKKLDFDLHSERFDSQVKITVRWVEHSEQG